MRRKWARDMNREMVDIWVRKGNLIRGTEWEIERDRKIQIIKEWKSVGTTKNSSERMQWRERKLSKTSECEKQKGETSIKI